jgi:Tfp pilus assembly protein PilV
MKITKRNKNDGFYLIEAIIAMFLLTVGLLVAVDLLSKTMTGNIEDRENITAVALAQEGVELVRNLRDNNFAQGKKAFDTQYFPAGTSLNCRIDKDNNINSSNPNIICDGNYVLI